MHDTGCLGLVHWDDLEGWDGEGGGRGVQDGERMHTHCRFKSMYGKTKTILYCKVKLKKKEINGNGKSKFTLGQRLLFLSLIILFSAG